MTTKSKRGAVPEPEPVPVVVERIRLGPVPPEVIAAAKKGLKTKIFDIRYCDEPSQGGQRVRRRERHESFDPQYMSEYRVEDLFEYDHAGWTPIHYASFDGLHDAVDTMLTEIPLLTNLPTADDNESSPLLLAVMANNLDMIERLLGYNADPYFVDWHKHGVVELCAFKQYLHILRYFIKLNLPEMSVWKRLVDMAASPLESDALGATTTLRVLLTKPSEHKTNVNWKSVYDNGFAPVITAILGSVISEPVKMQAFDALLSILVKIEVKTSIVEAGILPIIVHLLSVCTNKVLLHQTAVALESVCQIPEYAAMVMELGVMTALEVAMRNTSDVNSLAAIVIAISKLVENNSAFQDNFRETKGAVETLVGLYSNCTSRSLLQVLTDCVSNAARANPESQKRFVAAGVGQHLNVLINVLCKPLMLSTIEALHTLAEFNPETQRVLLASAIPENLLNMMKRTRYLSIQERTAGALWSMAVSNVEERLMMAERMSVLILNEYLTCKSPLLNQIAASAWYALVCAPLGLHDKLHDMGTLPMLIELLHRPDPLETPMIAGRCVDKETTLLAIVRTLGASCVRGAYVRYPPNQVQICDPLYNCLPTLFELLIDPMKPELIRAETAYTLGCIALGNRITHRQILQYPNFSYGILLDMFSNCEDIDVQQIVGSTLSMFAYNSVDNQNRIAEAGLKCEKAVLTFKHYRELLKPKDQLMRAHFALQMVIMCRCFPDNKPAETACHGIKILSDLMERAKTDHVRTVAANAIATLSHTRPGLPDAFISIDTVHSLTALLIHNAEHVRGYAAIALGYLTFNPTAKRQIMNACRIDPLAYKVLRHYTKHVKLSPEFLEDWQHYVLMGLPPIDPSRPQLNRRAPMQLIVENRLMTLSGEDDRGLEPDAEEPEGDEIAFPKEVDNKFRKKTP